VSSADGSYAVLDTGIEEQREKVKDVVYVQPISDFSSRSHSVGLCRTLLLVFSIAAPGIWFCEH